MNFGACDFEFTRQQPFPKFKTLEKVFSPHVERDVVFPQNDFEFGGVVHEGTRILEIRKYEFNNIHRRSVIGSLHNSTKGKLD